LTIKINDINDNSLRFQETKGEHLVIDAQVITVKAFDAERKTKINQTNFKKTSVRTNMPG